MRFQETSLGGVFLVDVERREDERGFFARSFCEEEFAQHGLVSRFVQTNISFNKRRGTLRGLHFQKEPKPEAKLIRVVRGSIYDVVVDLRPSSPTYRQWRSFELRDHTRQALYVPPGFAHGFQTLTDDSELLYYMGEVYAPELAAGIRWNDPAFSIPWPLLPPIVSEKDASFPDFSS